MGTVLCNYNNEALAVAVQLTSFHAHHLAVCETAKHNAPIIVAATLRHKFNRPVVLIGNAYELGQAQHPRAAAVPAS